MKEAWHFVEKRLINGDLVPKNREVLNVNPPLILGHRGLHFAYKILDALEYARGFTACRVRVAGKIIDSEDISVCSKRTILWRVNARGIILRFANKCALDVINLWDPPESVRNVLGDTTTGFRSINKAIDIAIEAVRSGEAGCANAARAFLCAARLKAMELFWPEKGEYQASDGYWAARGAAMAANEELDSYNKLLESLILAEHEKLMGL